MRSGMGFFFAVVDILIYSRAITETAGGGHEYIEALCKLLPVII